MTERDCILVLHAETGMGREALEQVMSGFPVLENIFGATEEQLSGVPGIGPRRAERLCQIDPRQALERLLQDMEKVECQVTTVLDEDYPHGLKEQKQSPAALFYQGDLGRLSMPVVSIVGTRRASSYGTQMAYSMARDLTIQGVMVMSGMAIGIDTAAHQGALEKGKTVAVLGSGFSVIYPPQNRGLAGRIRLNGLMLSPFPPATSPARWTFPRRNRVMAALSRAVVVVEAGEKSGALLTAEYAEELGVQVFAVPGQVNRTQAKGVLSLLRNGAKVAAGAEDVLEQLSIHPGAASGGQEEVEKELQGKELEVWQVLEERGLPPEVVAQEVGINLTEVWEVLLEMEMKGLISQSSGGVYSRRIM